MIWNELWNGIGDAFAQPVEDAVEIIDGMTEGELRAEAAKRLGAQAVVAMTTAEIISWWERTDQ